MIDDGSGGLTNIGDADPAGDVCSTSTGEVFSMTGMNIGNLLNAAGVSWGFFEGGFDLTVTNPNGSTGCSRSTTSLVTGTKKADYIPHHQPFQYYASTANLMHTPSHVRSYDRKGGRRSQPSVRHQRFLHSRINAGNFPAVSFLKAPGYQDGHAGYSDPLDEQEFVVNTINFLQSLPAWSGHGGRHRLRRLGRLVRSPDRTDGEPVRERGRCDSGHRFLRKRGDCAAGSRIRHDECAGTLRIRSAPAADGDFALGQEQLRGSLGHRPDFRFCVSSKTIG